MGLLNKTKKVKHDLHELVGHVLDDRLRVLRLAYVSPRQWLYEAEPPSVGKTRCAIKILGDPSGREPGSFYRFKVICDRIKSSQSPRIEKILECGTLHDLTPYVVTTWESHTSLYEYLRRQKKPLTWQVAQPLFIEIAQGLSELHQANISHGDLRAHHVLLRKPPHDAVLIDYGVSAAFGAPPVPGMDKSLAYWAPERLTFAAATPATDLYSLGVLMYLCLSGHLPFEPNFQELQQHAPYTTLDPQSALIEFHRQHVVPVLDQIEVPQAIILLMIQLMDKEPAKRPSHIEDVLQILKNPSQHNVLAHQVTHDHTPDEQLISTHDQVDVIDHSLSPKPILSHTPQQLKAAPLAIDFKSSIYLILISIFIFYLYKG